MSAATIIAIAHHSGGVGKTTTTLSLAYALAANGAMVLVVDLDPQADLSTRLQIDAADPTLDRVLRDGRGTPATHPIRWADVGFDVIPADREAMADLDVSLYSAQKREERLRWALHAYRDQYAYILLDCPPNLSMLTTNALYAADKVLVPVQAQDKAVRQLAPFHDTLAVVQDYRAREPGGAAAPVVLGYLLTMVDKRTNQSQEAVTDVRRDYGDLVFQATIPDRTQIQADSRWQAPIGVYAPADGSAVAYAQLAQEVQARA